MSSVFDGSALVSAPPCLERDGARARALGELNALQKLSVERSGEAAGRQVVDTLPHGGLSQLRGVHHADGSIGEGHAFVRPRSLALAAQAEHGQETKMTGPTHALTGSYHDPCPVPH